MELFTIKYITALLYLRTYRTEIWERIIFQVFFITMQNGMLYLSYDELSKNIRLLRKQKGWTQIDLAEKPVLYSRYYYCL